MLEKKNRRLLEKVADHTTPARGTEFPFKDWRPCRQSWAVAITPGDDASGKQYPFSLVCTEESERPGRGREAGSDRSQRAQDQG